MCLKQGEKRVRGDDGWAIALLGAIGLSSLKLVGIGGGGENI